MTTQNLVIGLAVLVVVLGAWTTFAAKGVPWHQDSQQQQGGAAKRSGQQRGDQQRESRQGQDQQGQQQHGEQEEGEGDPADWTEEELKAWLKNRGETVDENTETRVMLLARVQDLRRE